jgi:amidase
MDPYSATNPLDLDANALLALLRGRELSCVELISATLDCVAALNPTFNAVIALRSRDTLLTEARQKDAESAKGVLFGLPIAIKDLSAAKGLPMTMGSPILKDFMPPEDSIFVERLRAAGAIVIGKTNTPEFGLGSQTYNLLHGATRNAYEPRLTAGGSSGGAAVALALGMLALADGSDYGGSLRNPAGWNNVYGLRPSIGRVPNDGRDGWLPSMGVNGPMARNPSDLAVLLSVMAGHDLREPLSLEGDGSAFAASLANDPKGTRIAWAADWNGALPCEPGVLDVCEQALKTFESLGCSVVPAVPEFSLDALWDAWVTLRHWQVGANLAPFWNDPALRSKLKPEAQWEVELGAKLSAFDISAASATRTRWSHALTGFFERYDFLVLPTAQVFPFAVEIHWPNEIAGTRMTTYHEWMKCVVPGTMSGGPTLAAPAGFDARGLPMGLQLIGRNRAELACLRLAWAYHEAARPDRRRPRAIG